MTVLTSAPRITSVRLVGLEGLNFSLVSHVLEGALGAPGTEIDALNAHPEDKYIVRSIDGLGPPNVDVAIAPIPGGGKYQGRQVQKREVIFTIELNPDWDAGETPKLLRDNLYTMLSPGYDPRVDIQLIASIQPIAHSYAYVTQFEPVLFSKDPLVQITFECLNYTFKAYHPTSYSPADLDLDHPNVYNYGTAETGFKFAVKFTDDMDGWFIKQAENQKVGMEFDMAFQTNDVLSVSTIPGSLYVHWNKRRGKVQNKMGILKNSSEWITLHPGMNHFVVPKRDKWVWKGNLQFTPTYWGV